MKTSSQALYEFFDNENTNISQSIIHDLFGIYNCEKNIQDDVKFYI